MIFLWEAEPGELSFKKENCVNIAIYLMPLNNQEVSPSRLISFNETLWCYLLEVRVDPLREGGKGSWQIRSLIGRGGRAEIAVAPSPEDTTAIVTEDDNPVQFLYNL